MLGIGESDLFEMLETYKSPVGRGNNGGPRCIIRIFEVCSNSGVIVVNPFLKTYFKAKHF